MNKRKRIIAIAAVLAAVSMNMTAQPAQRTLWNDGWTFTKDGESRVLDLPHDWGVDGPFVQEYPGETGKLAWWGKAEYSKNLSVTAKDLRSGKRFLLDFGGAMSYAKVFCNGKAVTEWPYGYASFRADLTPFVKEGDNLVKVTLDNPGESSRWYPGGGIYRNVYLTKAGPAGVAQWGTFVSTKGNDVSIGITLRNAGKAVGGTVRTEIVRVINPGSSVTGPVEVVVDGKTRKAIVTKLDAVTDGGEVIQKFKLKDARSGVQRPLNSTKPSPPSPQEAEGRTFT